MSKINFVRASLTKTQYATTFLNKTKKKSINTPNEVENYILTTQDTPISCITPEQDFNYFLAKGCRAEINISNCQVGFPLTELSTSASKFKHSGSVSYSIKPGKVIRSSLTLYSDLAIVIPPPPPPPLTLIAITYLSL
jgi:hypothetical protein